jgi:hypothetical protein
MDTNNYFVFNLVPELIELINNPNENNDIIYLKLNKQKYNDYRIITYNKSVLTDENIEYYGICRSIIINSKNKVVSFSPAKSIKSDVFMNTFPNRTDYLIAQEFVEGTMINVFWDRDQWEITTKNVVGANTSFFKCDESKTFKEMFFEALTVNNLILDILNKHLCYSFVLQHPNNRIVIPITQPQLYLVAVYQIINVIDDNSDDFNNKLKNVFIYPCNLEHVKLYGMWSWTGIKFPKTYYDWNNYDDLINNYASNNTPYDIQGVVIYNSLTNTRCKFRNPNYEIIKKLRGNQPKLQYQYLILKNDGNIDNYLNYYPEHRDEFNMINNKINLFIKELYNNYVNYYIKKDYTIPFEYKTHMFNLHNIYINNLKPKKLYINISNVSDYVNELHPFQLMTILNCF